jgi:S1-C subfamily serine protease
MITELELEGGVAVADLGDGLIAEQTRIRPGFILTKVNGRTVTNKEQLSRLIQQSVGAVTLEGIYPDDPSRTYKYAIVK